MLTVNTLKNAMKMDFNYFLSVSVSAFWCQIIIQTLLDLHLPVFVSSLIHPQNSLQPTFERFLLRSSASLCSVSHVVTPRFVLFLCLLCLCSLLFFIFFGSLQAEKSLLSQHALWSLYRFYLCVLQAMRENVSLSPQLTVPSMFTLSVNVVLIIA